MEMFKQTIKIQSISDIITNSSSETFCRICSKEQTEEIYDLLKTVLPGDDTDYEPVIRLSKLYEDDKDYLPELFEEIEFGDNYVELDLPYGIWCPTFFKYGIEAVLKEKFPNSDYTIFYNNEEF